MSAPLLVFGANGQVGRELCRAAAAGGMAPVGFARGAADITAPEQIAAAIAASSPHVVINAAAYTAVEAAETNPDLAFRVNHDGPAQLAIACARAGIPLVHISTDYVFDGQSQHPYREDDPTAPLNVYGQSKEAGECAVRSGWNRHVILRTSWVYAAHGHNFVRTMLRLAGERSELRVVDDQVGCPTAAHNVAHAVLKICGALAAGATREVWGTFHYCDADAVTWCEFARLIFDRANSFAGRPPPRITPISSAELPSGVTRPRNSRLDCGKIARVYGIEPARLDPALARVLGELLAAPD